MAQRLRSSTSGLTPDETKASLRQFSWHAVMRGVFETVAGGTTLVFVAFARSLGIAPESMGLVTFWVSVACMLQMVALPLAGRFKRRKRFVLGCAIAEPVVFVLSVLIILWLPLNWQQFMLFVAVFGAAAFLNISRPLTDEWLATTIPAGIRGRYLGRRMQVLSVSVIAATLVCGWAVGWFGTDNTVALGLLLIIGGLFGLVAAVALGQAAMPQATATATSRWTDLLEIARAKPFRRCAAFVLVFNLPFYFACPYYQVFYLEVVKMPPMLIAYMHSGYFLVKILSLPRLGRWLDRFGARRLALACGVMYAAFFAVFPFCSEARHWPLLIAWALVAAADGAFMLAFQTVLYDSVPQSRGRPTYFAVFNFTTLAAAAIGSALSVPLLRLLRPMHWQVAAYELTGFHLLYLGCALVMLPCTAGIWLLPPKSGNRAGVMANDPA